MSKLLNILKFLLLVACSFCLAFIVVWPLWKFATSFSSVYTAIVLILSALFIIILIVKGIKRHGKK